MTSFSPHTQIRYRTSTATTTIEMHSVSRRGYALNYVRSYHPTISTTKPTSISINNTPDSYLTKLSITITLDFPTRRTRHKIWTLNVTRSINRNRIQLVTSNSSALDLRSSNSTCKDFIGSNRISLNIDPCVNLQHINSRRSRSSSSTSTTRTAISSILIINPSRSRTRTIDSTNTQIIVDFCAAGTGTYLEIVDKEVGTLRLT